MKYSHRRKNSGQVILLALVVLIALLVGALLLFDLHNAIRGKIKVETAQQSAALAGANWQLEGLNLIGQLNLAKAADAIGYAAAQKDDNYVLAAMLERRIMAMTELQSRCAFITPVLGVIAAQQAAKQNGMPNTNSTLRHYVEDNLPLHDHRLRSIQGYFWFAPYSALLESTSRDGAAVRVNSIYGAMPEVWSNNIGFSFNNGMTRVLLSDRKLYDAVMYDDYCYWQLKALAKAGKTPNADWLKKISYIDAPFCEESELLTLGVDYRPSASLPEELLGAEKLNWCVYDDSWSPDNFHKQSYDAHSNMWRRGMWLRDDIKPGFRYEGAITAIDNYVSMPRFNRIGIKKPAAGHKLAAGNNLAYEKEEEDTRIGYSPSDYDASNYGVVAKVFGAFNQGENRSDSPVTTPIILPVFTHTAIIPSTMPYNIGMMTNQEEGLKIFLKYLAEGGDLYGTAPDGSERYQAVLQKLDSGDFLKSIYNPDFSGVDNVSLAVLFTDLYKFPDSGNGAGWLQQAWLGKMRSRPFTMVEDPNAEQKYDKEGNPIPKVLIKKYLVNENEIKEVTDPIIEPDGATRTYFGNDKNGYMYFLRKNGRILTNEDIACDSARRGDTGGTFPPGSNSGPGRL